MDDTHPTCVTIVKEEDTGKNERGMSIFLLSVNFEHFVVSEINDRIDEGTIN